MHVETCKYWLVAGRQDEIQRNRAWSLQRLLQLLGATISALTAANDRIIHIVQIDPMDIANLEGVADQHVVSL